MSRKIKNVNFIPNNGRVGLTTIIGEFDDNISSEIINYYTDELEFSEDELIGLTDEQIHKLYNKKAIAFLNSLYNKNARRIIKIIADSEEEMISIRDSIYYQLAGNLDYINSKIIVNDSDDRRDGTVNEVHVIFKKECTELPELRIFKKDKNIKRRRKREK